MSNPGAIADHSTVVATAESRAIEFSAKVTVGEETARQLTEITGKLHSAGDTVDLGAIAFNDKARRLWGSTPTTYAEIFQNKIKAVK